MSRLVSTLAEELLAWRRTLEKMRGTNMVEVDAVIHQIDESIKMMKALRAADVVDKVVR